LTSHWKNARNDFLSDFNGIDVFGVERRLKFAHLVDARGDFVKQHLV
jgi:hypothetical protein